MIKIITTVGTSLFTNYCKSEVRDSFINDDYQDISDSLKELEKLPSSDYNNQKYQFTIEKVKSVTENKWITGLFKQNNDWEIKDGELNLNASAEIKSLIKIADNISGDFKVFLLYSDSVLSRLASEIIQDYLPKFIRDKKIEIQCELIENLVVDSLDKFNDGLINLVKKIREIFKNEFNIKGNHTFNVKNKKIISNDFIFNISGGYKATLPYLTLLAQLYNIKSQYIFENSEELISIPNINIGFDEFFIEKIYMDLSSKSFNDSLQILELENYGLIQKNNGKFELTVLGEMIRDYAENNSYNSKNVFGYIAEFKLYEYFNRNTIKLGNNKLKNIERSVIYQKEFDIVLSSEDRTKLIFCEVKAYHSFIKKNEIFRNDFETRINAINNHFNNPFFEYHFYIYSLNSLVDEIEIKNKAKEIKSFRPEITIKFFKVLIKESNASYSAENPYQKIVSSKIEPKDIKEIKIN